MSDRDTCMEEAFVFPCGTERLVGIVASPAQQTQCRTGVLIIVGGPQYRVGSHRQFVHLSRYLAAGGVACMRFDYRGMGDSTGPMRTFEEVAEDIRAAIDAFLARSPGLDRVILWGLCDGASAATFHASNDVRVGGLILANPWVRTPAGQAEAYLRHYYVRRLLDPAFWRKVMSGQFRVTKSMSDLKATVQTVRATATSPGPAGAVGGGSLPERVANGLARFAGPVSLLMSEDDYTAAEFRDRAKDHRGLRSALSRCDARWVELPGADHTFSTPESTDRVARATLDLVLRQAAT